MCGIAGAIPLNEKHIASKTILAVRDMTSALSHRGPDNQEVMESSKFVFGHTRLSIIDLSERSNQPMMSACNKVTIVFNGEIYNHEDLRSELSEEFLFKTKSSDTEVILNSYLKWGVSCLDRFHGMFSMALFDARTDELYLIRDRFGKKPLFWSEVENTIYFASESNALFSLDEIPKSIDDSAIYDYLTFLTTPAPRTFFKGINKVPAGHYLKIKGGKKNLEKYWDISDKINTVRSGTDEDFHLETKKLLESSMKLRNVADVPISIALSGGLDSSLNLYYLNELGRKDLKSINISYEKTSEFDESKIAKRYSEEKNIDFHSFRITENDFSELIEEYLNCSKDSPAGDPNTALLYGISKISKDLGCKVLLVGEGGDELGGYPIYKKLKTLNYFYSFIPKVLLRFALLLPFPFKIKKSIKSILDTPPLVRRFVFGFSEPEKKGFWKGSEGLNSYKKILNICDEIVVKAKDQFLRKVLNVEYKLRLAELLLPRVDYPSMAAGVEARSPFMDHNLIEFCASLPFDYKMKNGPKSNVRSVAKDKLPSYILDAPKVGFGMLLKPFLTSTINDWFSRDVLKPGAPVQNYIDISFLEELLEKNKKFQTHGYQVWVIYSLNRWLVHHEA
tara:strand:+ start:5447 stop:7306 length:1860 start_codon:yes stop_codon:yes gene_type:complete